jgi:hypothetical protein
MRSIEVDDEVFALLQKGATPLVDTPNSAIRKLLGLRVNGARARTGGTTVELDGLLEEALAERRNKAPKADLRQLVQAGLLHAGDRLHFEAVVSGGMLEFKGQHYSMSSLAQELLKKVGFKSDSVRGPAHWVTSKGASVKELWQQLLDRRARK